MPSKYLYQVSKKLSGLGVPNRYWNRGPTYNRSDLDYSHAMVIILPNGGWQMNTSKIPKGCLNEYKRARRQGIPVFLAYWRYIRVTPHTEKELRFYMTKTTGVDFFTGVSNTSHIAEKQLIDAVNLKVKIKGNDNPTDHLGNCNFFNPSRSIIKCIGSCQLEGSVKVGTTKIQKYKVEIIYHEYDRRVLLL